MRAALTAAIATLGFGLMCASAQAADIYGPPPAYGAAPPPPVAYVAPPPVYGPPPVVAYGAPGVIAAPEGPVYFVPPPAYQPGGEYTYVDRRPYLECWFEWGQRRCVARPRPY